ncbi:MAG: hypothetical protein KME13_18455 [Myxacorys californica WJT36-NPBG1]|jgi:muramidase (phage lysozyme)/cell wall-associated NlpC family hydrolase|nr:hypothetical protein [Myxacorys californica WJT36-NPBG1]
MTILINPNQGRSLLTPFIRVTIGDKDIFQTGDGYLKAASITLDEMEAGSSCSFTVSDPGSKIADKYFQIIKAVKGLTPVQVKEETTPPSNPGNASNSATDNNQSANMKAFLDTIAYGEGANYNTKVGGGTFVSYKDHPRVYLASVNSDAAGRYQFISTTWDGLKSQLGLKDFNSVNQDKAAVALIKERGATSAVESGNLDGAMDILYPTWACFPPSPQAHITREQFRAYFKQMQAKYSPGVQQARTAVDSTQAAGDIPKVPITTTAAYTGSQITVELGFSGQLLAASSFIHTSIKCSRFDSPTLTFEGQSAAWVLTQRIKNTAYKNLSLRQMATKICTAYGLKLDMKEEGPKYEYFPQRGVSDYESLLIECKRIGYRIYCRGNILYIYSGLRKKGAEAFILTYADNCGFVLNVSHQARSDEGSDKKFASGQRKTVVDPSSGVQKIINLENPVGAGVSPDTATTGTKKPEVKPKTDGATDVEDDARREGQSILSQVDADFECPTTPELLTLDPNSAFASKGFSDFLDRYWILKSISHSYDVSSGFSSNGILYSPIKRGIRKSSTSSGNNTSTSTSSSPIGGKNDALYQAALKYKGSDTSAGPGNGNEACVYAINRVFQKAGINPPWGNSEYVPTAESALQSQATLVSQAQAQPGDIVIWDNAATQRGHIGIVTQAGATKVLSNSSSKARFVWEDSNSTYESFYGVKARIYRVK